MDALSSILPVATTPQITNNPPPVGSTASADKGDGNRRVEASESSATGTKIDSHHVDQKV